MTSKVKRMMAESVAFFEEEKRPSGRSKDSIVKQRKVFSDCLEKGKNYDVSLYTQDSLKVLEKSFEQIVTEQKNVLPDIDTQSLQFQIEYMKSQFEVFREQANYHFLFNCLNMLSCLLVSDVKKAQLFLEEFSNIYRYVLVATERPLISLNEELEFIHSYLFLQQINFGENLTCVVNVPSELLHFLVPPLSLQILVENAIKHNTISQTSPLNIEITCEGEFLILKNMVQPKMSVTSTNMGQKILINRYALLSKLSPAFLVVNNYYVARIPLISKNI